MRLPLTTLLILLGSFIGLQAQTNLPSLAYIEQRAIDRAVTKEDKNDDLFNQTYSYTRVRTWQYRDGKGNLKSFDQKKSYENRQLRALQKPQHPIPTPPALQNTNATIQGKALKVKNFSITNIVSKFVFTLVGTDTINNRLAYVLDFVPKKNLPVTQLADHAINIAAGRVWIDAEDFAVVQGQVHLTKPISLVWGAVGEVKVFTYSFTRVRTPEGFWFARRSDWHLEAREVVINRIVDYHEIRVNEQKITPATLELELKATHT